MASVQGWHANPWNGLYLKKTIPKTVPGKFKGCSHLFIFADQSNLFSFSQPEEFVETNTLKFIIWVLFPLSTQPPLINGAQSLSLKSERNITLWLQKLTPGASLRHLLDFWHSNSLLLSLLSEKHSFFFHLTDKLLLSTNWFLSIVLTVEDIDRNIIIFFSKYVKFNESKHYLPHGEESVFLKQSCGCVCSWSRESCILPHCCLSDVWQLIPSCFIILSSFKILYVQNTGFSSSFTLSVLQHVSQINITFPCTSWVSWRCRNLRKERPGVEVLQQLLSWQREAPSESWDKQAVVAHALRRKEQQMSHGWTEEGPSPSSYKKKDGGGLEGRGSS